MQFCLRLLLELVDTFVLRTAVSGKYGAACFTLFTVGRRASLHRIVAHTKRSV